MNIRSSALQQSFDLLSHRILGVAPFDDLVVNAAFWRRAHDHHHLHRQIHSALVHRPGIVWGLEVLTGSQIPDDRAEMLYVAPGVAIDANGQTIVVSQAFEFSSADVQKGLNVLVSRWKQTDDNATNVTFSGGSRPYGIVEEHDVQYVHREPHSDEIELARFEASDRSVTITPADDPFSPGVNEIDFSFRTPAFPACAGVLRVAWLKCAQHEAPQNRAHIRRGFALLVQNARQNGFHIEFEPPFEFGSSRSTPDLLLMGGHAAFEALRESDVSALRAHLARGGNLWGEVLGPEFAQAFSGLVRALGASMKLLPEAHALLSAHSTFAMPPAGAGANGEEKTRLDEATGVIVTTGNYSSLWGGMGPFTRTQISDATDWGFNVLAHAAQRTRRFQLISLLTEGT